MHGNCNFSVKFIVAGGDCMLEASVYVGGMQNSSTILATMQLLLR